MSRNYDHLHTLSFGLADGIEHLAHPFVSLRVPTHWKSLLLELQAGATGHPVEKTTVPSRSVSRLFRAVVPDLIAIEPYAWAVKSDTPWLYSAGPVDCRALFILVHSWAQAEFGCAHSERERVLSELRAEDLQWVPETVDLAAWRTAANGTAEPQYPSTFHIFPDLLAAILSQHEIELEVGTEPLRFRRVPLAPGERGAELVSWPPRYHQVRGRQWPYSVFVTLTVQTVPFCPRPAIYCEFGIRRWAPSKTTILGREDTGVYILTEVPWIPALHHSSSFQVAPIRWAEDREKNAPKLIWGSHLASVLSRLRHPDTPLPDPDVLRNEADTYLTGQGTLTAAIVFRNGMAPRHEVHPGLPPEDRRRLAEQVAAILAGQGIVFTERPSRVALTGVRKAKNPFAVSVKPAEGDNQVLQERRLAVCRSIGPHITFEAWYQSERVCDALTVALCEQLGLGADTVFPYSCPLSGLTIHLRRRHLDTLGDGLRIAKTGGFFRDRLHRAILDRVRLIEEGVPGASHPTMAFVELADRTGFEQQTDPKHALRKGFGHTGRLTQFINTDDEQDNLAHRAVSCVRDALRQLGVQPSVPTFTNKNLPQALNFIGVWLIKEFAASSPTRNQHFLPVMIRVEGATGQIYAIAGGMDEWQSYPAVLVAIAQGKVAGVRQEREALPILRNLLRRDILAVGEVLMLCHTQNLRRAWPWIGNGRITADRLGFYDDTPQPMAAWPGMRFVRIRDSDGHETPEWYAVDAAEQVGFPGALYQMGERVFASTHGKPEQLKTLSRFTSKLSSWTNAKGTSRSAAPDIHTWNAGLLEIVTACLQPGDDPTAWAALTHRLRSATVHYDDATALPLPLHLAQKMREYVLPVGDLGDGE